MSRCCVRCKSKHPAGNDCEEPKEWDYSALLTPFDPDSGEHLEARRSLIPCAGGTLSVWVRRGWRSFRLRWKLKKARGYEGIHGYRARTNI